MPSVDRGGLASSATISSILQRCVRATGVIRSLDIAGVANMSGYHGYSCACELCLIGDEEE